MSHFARVVDGVVDSVIVAEQDFIDTLPDKDLWVQTSYNTRGNLHYGADGQPDGGLALRGNYAGVGYTYDPQNDVFYGVKPHPEATLDPTTWTWFWNEIPSTLFMDGNQ
jgi:hypothetical protein